MDDIDLGQLLYELQGDTPQPCALKGCKGERAVNSWYCADHWKLMWMTDEERRAETGERNS